MRGEFLKQATIQISFDTEKLNALKQFMGTKNLNLTDELTVGLTKLYEKHVPGAVRLYIEGRTGRDKKPRTANKGDSVC